MNLKKVLLFCCGLILALSAHGANKFEMSLQERGRLFTSRHDRILRTTIVSVDFRKYTITDAINKLRELAKDAGKNLNIVIGPDVPSDTEITLALDRVPLSACLDYICRLAALESNTKIGWKIKSETVEIGVGIKSKKKEIERSYSARETRRKGKQKIAHLFRTTFQTLIFEETPLDESLEYLGRRSKEYNGRSHTGVNFVLLRNPNKPMPKVTLYLGGKQQQTEGKPIVTLETALNAVCRAAGADFEVEEHAVVIMAY